MKHFTNEEWLRFIQARVEPRVKGEEMEAHLSSCNICLQRYLAVLEIEGLKNKSSLVSPGFADRVMLRLEGVTAKESQKTPGRKGINLIRYYAAAACLTLVIMGSGFFDLAGEYIPRATSLLFDSTIQTDGLFTGGWSHRLLQKGIALKTNMTEKWGDFFEEE